ncbi:MBL fold metallo-hydrolase [Actinoplanes rectilineatus]|uniref:MBL fold metallo-hydrolase n=1 Tax=Actinoplanes rectilineatus TaxID=113571 RepID=UPI0005F2CBB3|nr:MBL fold metallo-hydrolase [Actinoplanes rectilineatus]
MDVVTLEPRLHMLAFPVGHAYLWVGEDGLTLIDTGEVGKAPAVADAITGLGFRTSDVRRVLLTHFHDDHVGSAAAIAGWGDVLVYAHSTETPIIRGLEPGPPPVLRDWERPLFEQLPPRVLPGPVRVDRELTDGDPIDLGGVDAVAVHVPGHTPGSVAYYLPEPRILFTGDTVARLPDGTVILGVFNVDHDRAVDSLRRQAALDVGIACFGHGTPLTGDASARLRRIAADQR